MLSSIFPEPLYDMLFDAEEIIVPACGHQSTFPPLLVRVRFMKSAFTDLRSFLFYLFWGLSVYVFVVVLRLTFWEQK